MKKAKIKKVDTKELLKEPLTVRSGWAVQSLKGHICINSESMPAVFMHRPMAVEFRNALIPHIGKGKVIPVEIAVYIGQK
jgi:hypothetical protein